ncbi:hypothetical protein CMI38_01955 [Candidatus Pacearchaeota archaeon]|jgi:translation elongation factor P/translation initiation factor 5A|nr:hypothetical protein [Candidatus Pacearchaeota archaeon]|tara:strand:- start:1652 stop:1867 length:216 start_codon:yes stop_codon:yes gene_type:complete
MKKKAIEIKEGDRVNIAGKLFNIKEIEVSDTITKGKSGANGKRKVRLVAVDKDNQKIIIIRPEDYPIECPE